MTLDAASLPAGEAQVLGDRRFYCATLTVVVAG
jgi:hypothetical protein